MVIAPAKTGNARTSKNAVIKIDQTNNGILNNPIPGARILKTVTMIFIDPKIEDMPARCKLKIAISTAAPG